MEKYLPKVLDKDFTSLSKRLSFGQRKRISDLALVQKAAREKMRFVLFQMYSYVDSERAVEDQALYFRSWDTMLHLLIDDGSGGA